MTWNMIITLLLLLGKCHQSYKIKSIFMTIGGRRQFLFPSKYGSFQTTFQQSAPPLPHLTASQSRIASLSTPPQADETSVPSVLFVHGFGGNADQFRKNLPFLASNGYPSYAIDLLGYGYGEKPNPKQYEVNELYNFYTWSDQIIALIEKEIQSPTVIVANSVGCIAALVAAIQRPDLIKGLCLINISLRLLHKTKQTPIQRVMVPIIQSIFRETFLGKWFFQNVAKKETLKTILSSAYGLQDPSQMDDEVVELILKPGLDPKAADVFLDFISYSGGPLPEELIPQVKCPLTIIWGENDPWEPIDLATKAFSGFPTVKEFVRLPGGGHCPMDQIPDQVNAEILKFLKSDVTL